MILRRRDDLAMVVRELGGSLFAVEGNVDNYFKPALCDEKFEDGRGQIFLCEKHYGHIGSHESGDMEWWDAAMTMSRDWRQAPDRICSGEPLEPVRVDAHNWPSHVVAMFRLWLLRESVERHIREGPQREAAALRKAKDGK